MKIKCTYLAGEIHFGLFSYFPLKNGNENCGVDGKGIYICERKNIYLLQLKYNRLIKMEQINNCADIARTAGSHPIYSRTIYING